MNYTRAFARRVRASLKRRALRVLRALGIVPDGHAPPPPVQPPASAAPVERAPAEAPPTPPPEVEPTMEELVLTREAVEELLEDMVRPALQSDGGDIQLIRVEPEGDVFVELVGACSTCPSATVTMRQGIERLMHAELPGFRSLIEVNGTGGPPTDLSAHA